MQARAFCRLNHPCFFLAAMTISKLASFGGEYDVRISGGDSSKKTTPICIFITDTASPRIGAYVYTVYDPIATTTVSTTLYDNGQDLDDMCRSMGRVISLRFHAPVYVNINGRLDSATYQELLNRVVASVGRPERK